MTVKEFFETMLTGKVYDVEIYNVNTDDEFIGTTETIAESELIEYEIINWNLFPAKIKLRETFSFTVC